jgi:hypothetical protein
MKFLNIFFKTEEKKTTKKPSEITVDDGFSEFFHKASVRQKKKVIRQVVHDANKDQAALMKRPVTTQG